MLTPAPAKFHLAHHTHFHIGLVWELSTAAQNGEGLEVKKNLNSPVDFFHAVFLLLRQNDDVCWEKRWRRL